ncbi:hypothetical protein KVR01_006768 [Diaporthe batatas]|uniref:uncharacterized protein n=1 Tax=Diaporthe batatas TaxID=748121 RepID=UPI001D04740D|nr:uncharacterized protein KVR01_006768 [Diaporthe batatas]KAG8163471.1 hypothetical protein KVR01_006768 [Diaporthe batatas]
MAVDRMSEQKQSYLQLSFPIPRVTDADLCAFHHAHFGEASAIAFTADFLNLEKVHQDIETQHRHDAGDEAYYEGDEDEDGLGYYADGVKRTLTDAQIAMFRHSETQALQRAQERSMTRRNSSSPPPMCAHVEPLEGHRSEDGELSDDVSNTGAVHTKKKRIKKKKKRGSGNSKRHYSPDPERRKRTWDVVETGLDALDYGGSGPSQPQISPTSHRRRITYDDDDG